MPFTAVPVDDPRAQALLTAYFDERAAGFPVAGAYRTAFPSPAAFEPPAGVFLLELDAQGEAVGCGGIRRLSAERYEVKHLYLSDGARGSGLGRALLAELEARAAGFGASEVVLDTNASLVAANRLYVSAGYASIPAYNDNPNATTWYRKPLTREV